MAARSAAILSVWALVFGCSSATGSGAFGNNPTPTDPATEEPTEEPTEENPDTGTEPVEGADSGTGKTDTGSTTTDTGSSTPDTAGDPPVTGLPLIANLAIAEVAFLQGVKVSVEKAGVRTTARVADVIAGREALVRVFIAPKSGWTAREVVGELKLVSSAGEKTFSATLTPSTASTDGALASSLNFTVPTGVLAPDSKYSVSLFEKSGTSTGDTSGARYPVDGSTELLDAKSTGEVLKIKIVPVKYMADGSGRLPDFSAAQIERYRKAFYAMYPAKKVEVTVREPYAWSSAIDRGGSGFSTLLQAMVKLRQADGAPKDVYYYGAFAAKDTFSNYCYSGCVTGLCGLLTYPSDATGRACVGVGFAGTQSAETAAHEIGHAHGRAHAPCGTSDADSKYPYSGGKIGSWGYDVVDKKLYSPSTYTDFMGYCSPTWISDYTFKAIATRMSYVSSSAMMIYPEDTPRTYRFVDVAGDGHLTWGDTVTLTEPPIAEPHTVTYVADDGSVLDTATGAYYPYDDMPGGYMLVPELPVSVREISVAGLAAGVEARLSRLPASP